MICEICTLCRSQTLNFRLRMSKGLNKETYITMPVPKYRLKVKARISALKRPYLASPDGCPIFGSRAGFAILVACFGSSVSIPGRGRCRSSEVAMLVEGEG
jgi:hypothetical protein